MAVFACSGKFKIKVEFMIMKQKILDLEGTWFMVRSFLGGLECSRFGFGGQTYVREV